MSNARLNHCMCASMEGQSLIVSTWSQLRNIPFCNIKGGKIEIFGYEGGRGSIHGNMHFEVLCQLYNSHTQ